MKEMTTTVFKPVGYLQLLCLAAILAAAALRLPAQSLSFLGDELDFTIISSEGGRFVFFGVIAGVVLTGCQLLALRSLTPSTGRHTVAMIVSGAGTFIGLAIFGLGIRIGWFPQILEDMSPSPGIGAFVVLLAGAGFACLSGLRLWRLLQTKQAEPVAAPDPAT